MLTPTPKIASPRGSVASFLEPEGAASRSRCRRRAESTEAAPVATTVSATAVSGRIETQIFKDGPRVQVFVPDIPVPKVPPRKIGDPSQRAAPDPLSTKVKLPPPGVVKRRPKEGAAAAPHGEQPPKRRGRSL